MKLLILRHAPAEAREIYATTGESEESRPLTDAGRKKMRKAARALNALLPYVDLAATSPLARAAESAQILADAYGELKIAEVKQLAPGHTPESVLAWLKAQKKADTIALVGHEPDLSRLVSWLLTGKKKPVLELKKGAACLLEFADGLGHGKATLLWALAPSHLRKLA